MDSRSGHLHSRREPTLFQSGCQPGLPGGNPFIGKYFKERKPQVSITVLQLLATSKGGLRMVRLFLEERLMHS